MGKNQHKRNSNRQTIQPTPINTSPGSLPQGQMAPKLNLASAIDAALKVFSQEEKITAPTDSSKEKVNLSESVAPIPTVSLESSALTSAPVPASPTLLRDEELERRKKIIEGKIRNVITEINEATSFEEWRNQLNTILVQYDQSGDIVNVSDYDPNVAENYNSIKNIYSAIRHEDYDNLLFYLDFYLKPSILNVSYYARERTLKPLDAESGNTLNALVFK